ncbi:protein of unknown function [Cupriavidus taiwanensis]|nr:protein of unknown function [Cupriavidus taiwanensis]
MSPTPLLPGSVGFMDPLTSGKESIVCNFVIQKRVTNERYNCVLPIVGATHARHDPVIPRRRRTGRANPRAGDGGRPEDVGLHPRRRPREKRARDGQPYRDAVAQVRGEAPGRQRRDGRHRRRRPCLS